MPRFERRRDHLHQFWEVAIDGSEVTFRFGEVGTPGRSRTQRHRTEAAARNAAETGEKEMTQRGYRRVLEAQPGPVDASPVFDRLLHGDDEEAWLIHADWLQEQGDPLGDTVARALQGQPTPWASERLDSLSAQVRAEQRNGYLDLLEVVAGSATVVDDPDATVLEVLQQPRSRLLRTLRLTSPHATSVVPHLDLPALTSLSLAVHLFRPGPSRDSLDLDALAARSPRLDTLGICSAIRLVGTGGLERLTTLSLRSWPFTSAGQLQRLAPRRLELHHVDEGDLRRLLKSGLVHRAQTLVFASGGLDLLVRYGGPAHIVFPRSLYDVHVVAARIPGLERVTLEGSVPAALIVAFEQRGIQIDGAYRVHAEPQEPSAPVRPRDLDVTRLENIEGRTPRFWEIGRVGNVLHVRYGQLGNDGRWTWRAYPDDEIAREARNERVKEKIRQGYALLEDRTDPPTE